MNKRLAALAEKDPELAEALKTLKPYSIRVSPHVSDSVKQTICTVAKQDPELAKELATQANETRVTMSEGFARAAKFFAKANEDRRYAKHAFDYLARAFDTEGNHHLSWLMAQAADLHR